MPPKGSIHNPELRHILGEEPHFVHFEPIAADNNWFKTTVTFTGAENESKTVTSFTKDYCPGWPVCPVIVVTDAADDDWTGVTSVVKGFDQFGDFITETVVHAGGGTPWTGTCLNAFEKIVSITTTVAGTTTSSDTYIIGFVKTYGLGCRITATSEVIASLHNGANDTGTVSIAYNTYTIAGTPNALEITLLYIRPKYYYR